MGCKHATLATVKTEEHEWENNTQNVNEDSDPYPVGKLYTIPAGFHKEQNEKEECDMPDTCTLKTAGNTPLLVNNRKLPSKLKQINPDNVSDLKSISSVLDSLDEMDKSKKLEIINTLSHAESSLLECAPFAVSPIKLRFNPALIKKPKGNILLNHEEPFEKLDDKKNMQIVFRKITLPFNSTELYF